MTDHRKKVVLFLKHLLNYAGASGVSNTKILLLSDGEDTIGSLDYLTNLGIKVDTIAYR